MRQCMLDTDEFTEAEYKRLLRAAKQHRKLILFSSHDTEDPAIIMRHDVDISFHRAVALAEIEALEGISSTYFVHLHSKFYNPLDDEISKIIFEILEYGHELGLHFDPEYWGNRVLTEEQLNSVLEFEKNILEQSFDTKVKVFSWHNPTVSGFLSNTTDTLAGMINAYGSVITSRYKYVSDSNGIWRHHSLQDVLEQAETHLQVLIHPEWWTPETMSPRDRILRAINGRAQATMRDYDQFLITHGRPNVGQTDGNN